MKFDEIISLKNGDEKTEKLKDWYTNEIEVSKWMTNPFKNSIIKYHDRTEYKKNGKFHRLNGPAVEYHIYDRHPTPTEGDLFYYNGILYEDKEEWLKVTTKELRKLKLKKLM